MTFDRDILGDARWPTSTRLGHQTQSRLLLLKGYDQAIRRLRRRRMLSDAPAVAAAHGAPGDRPAAARPQSGARRQHLWQARLEGCRSRR